MNSVVGPAAAPMTEKLVSPGARLMIFDCPARIGYELATAATTAHVVGTLVPGPVSRNTVTAPAFCTSMYSPPDLQGGSTAPEGFGVIGNAPCVTPAPTLTVTVELFDGRNASVMGIIELLGQG